MRTIFTSFALAAVLACQQALALTLTSPSQAPSVPTASVVPKVLAQVATKSQGDFDCDCDDICDECECPHLQDCGIDLSNAGNVGSVGGSGDVTITVGTTFNQDFPEILTSEATATNTCGLELSSNQKCGNVTKTKDFCISGHICIEETTTIEGCEGERECSDGRFTTTTQQYTESGPAVV
jgi:hypothetical protein